MEDEKEIKDFFEDIKELDNKLENEKQEDFNNLELSLPKLANKIYELKVKREERLKATKGRFNLFTTLLKIGDETRLHSRFITHLLNPQGNHDCGSLFLDLFIDMISSECNLESFESIKENEFIYGRTEQSTKEGRRIDIYLEFKDYKIAIENKIWAKEQDNQIADYAKEIDANDKNNFLFYLTLDGRESETSNKEIYFPISYKNHILIWLEKCLQATYKYININQAIQQYQNVIKELTNQTMEKEEMKEIEEMIKKNPVVLKYSNEIINSITEVKKSLTNDFIKDVFNGLNYKLDKCYSGDRNNPGNCGWKTHTTLSLKEKENCENNFLEKHLTCIEYRPEHGTLFIGMYPSWNDSNFPDWVEIDEKIIKIVEKIKNKDNTLQSKGWWGIEYFFIEGESALIKSNALFELNDKSKKNEFVKRIAKEINDFIELLKSKYNEMDNE